MIIYLDTCCYNRPFDDQRILRNAVETSAIMSIIDICGIIGHIIIGSRAVTFEHSNISASGLRAAVGELYDKTITYSVRITADTSARATALQEYGMGRMDSFHLAAAEAGNADVLLTVDDDFEHIVANKKLSSVRVINPVNFLTEVMI